MQHYAWKTISELPYKLVPHASFLTYLTSWYPMPPSLPTLQAGTPYLLLYLPYKLAPPSLPTQLLLLTVLHVAQLFHRHPLLSACFSSAHRPPLHTFPFVPSQQSPPSHPHLHNNPLLPPQLHNISHLPLPTFTTIPSSPPHLHNNHLFPSTPS